MVCILILLAFCSGVIAAQQLPAGTREADDDSTSGRVLTARIQTAEAALDKGDYATAATLLKALSADCPKDAHIAYDLGFAEERVGDEISAARAYADAARLDPTMAESITALGLLDARAGRSDQATTELERAAALKTASPELRARAFRALAAINEGKHPDLARDQLLEAVKLTGETPDDIAMGARLASHAGDPADAEKAYRRMLAAEPANAAGAASLAALLVKDGKTAEAEALLQSALKTHADDPQVVTELAALYGQEGKAAAGAALLKELRSRSTQAASDSSITRMLARLQSLAGQDAESAQLYGSLVPGGNADPLLLDEYGGVLVKLMRFAEAQAVFTRALIRRNAFPSDEEWADTESHLAFAASRNHEPRLALQALALRATVLPNSPSSLFLQAISYDALHQTGDAVKAYRAFLAVANGKYPDQEFQARHRLVALEHTR